MSNVFAHHAFTNSGAVTAGVEAPHNLDAEQGLLGAMLADRRAVEIAQELIAPEDFYAPAHQRIARALFDLYQQGRVPTAVLLTDYFKDDQDLRGVGGAEYLADLASAMVTVINTPDYCETIRDLRLRRDLIASCEGAVHAARRPGSVEDSGAAVLQALELDLFALAERGGRGGQVSPIADRLGSALDWIEKAQRGELRGIRTGIAALDERVRIMKSDLVILAGRPSMGKTAMAMTLAHNFAADANRTLMFSLEMSADQLIQRLFARLTGFPVQQQQDEGGLKAGDWRELSEARDKLARLPLSFDDEGALTVAQIRARARRHKRRHGLDVVIVDYLGLMTFTDKYQTKNDQLGEVTKALKAMAKELDIAVVLLSQLSRGVEGKRV